MWVCTCLVEYIIESVAVCIVYVYFLALCHSDLVFYDSVWKTPTQAVLDGADPRSVGITAEKEFPVSDGIQHHAVEAEDGPDNMGSLSTLVRGRTELCDQHVAHAAASNWW